MVRNLFSEISEGDLEGVKRMVAYNPHYLRTKDYIKRFPLDRAIANGKLDIAKFLFEKGGRPNLEIYCDGINTPVHEAAEYEHATILEWVFENKVLPLRVLNIKNDYGWTPLELAFRWRNMKTVALLQHFIHILDSVFLAMQRAKRDHQCVLRRLPNELLDMVVDEVAARYQLKVVW